MCEIIFILPQKCAWSRPPHLAFCGVNISCERKELLVSNRFHNHAATKCHPSIRNAVALVNAVFGIRSDGARASHHLSRVLFCHCGQHRDRVRVCRISLCVAHSHDPVCGECMETRMRMQCPLPQISQPLAGHGTHKAGHGNPTVIESSIYDCSVRGDQLPCWLGSPRCAPHVADGCCAPTHFSCHVMPALSSQSRPMSSAIVDVQRT
jgi:hypothetical protein